MAEKSSKALSLIAKGAIIFLIGMLASKLLGFIYRVILSRMGEQIYGELSLGIALFSILSTISILGLNTGALKFISTAREEKNNEKIKGTILFSSKAIITGSIILSIILFILSDWIALTFFNSQNLSIILKIFAIALPFEGLRTLFTNIFKAFKNVKYDIYGRVLTENSIKIILTIIFIYLGLGITGAAIAYSSSIILSFLIMLCLLQFKTFSLTTKINSVFNNKELLLYSLPVVLSSLTLAVMSWADTLMLGYFQNTSIVGIYNVAMPAAKLVLILPTALSTLFLPAMAALLNSKDEFKKTYQTTTKWILLVNFLALIWMIIYGKKLISFFFGQNYIAAYIPFVLLIIGLFINSTLYTSRDILLLKNKTGLILKITLVGCIINLLINLLLIPKYGMIGAAIASTMSLTIISISLLIASRKETSFYPFTRKTLYILIIGTISGIITKILTNLIPISNHIFIITFSILFITITSLFFFYLTKIIDKEDSNIAKDVIDRIKDKISI
jgi:O-antigen/teichoic acid export membrane protein